MSVATAEILRDVPSASTPASRHVRLSVCFVAVALFAVTTDLASAHHTAFDFSIVHAMNGIAGKHPLFDLLMSESTRVMFSTSLLVTAIWFVWFAARTVEQRAAVFVGTVVSLLSGAVSRGMQRLVATHPRPLHDAAFGFHLPYSVISEQLSEWSSFPSDHVVVFFGLAATVTLRNRKLGALCFALATVFSLVRVYLGYHWPTDCLGGAALGILLVEVARPLASSGFVKRIVPREGEFKPLFYAIAFYVTLGCAQLFDDPRTLASNVSHLLHHTAR